MSEELGHPKWFNIRLKKGIKERYPFYRARKAEQEGFVRAFNGAAHTVSVEEMQKRYEVTAVIPDKDQKSVEDRYWWEYHR